MYEGAINYTGNKSKLMPRLLDVFAKSDANRLVDVCCGGLSVTLHSQFQNVLANDYSSPLFCIYNHMDSRSCEQMLTEIENVIRLYGLSKTDKVRYEDFKAMTNAMTACNGMGPSIPLFHLVLQYHAFSNMMRFNEKGMFNTSFGQRTFNKSSKKKLEQFYAIKDKKNIVFSNKSFLDLEIKDDDFVYMDPPYLITEAVYNNGWDDFTDGAMMNWLDELHEREIKFAMSNVTHHRGKTNQSLIDWASKYNVISMNHKYVFNSYQAKAMDKETIEVIITNIC
ncbi:MAG: Dam family site-specific DNA-(adenine-N6)-methyltransferase [Cetobacterium sp.]|uniref:Dam family site-specific DNA-(adenine-N6)-methyltransferase n=1 Tax=Cetobacterium sp. TaxID=2071632 RepID=UPI003EE465EB